MMKNRKYSLLFGIAAAGLMLLAACSNIFDSPAKSPSANAPVSSGYGRVSINLVGGAERTLLPTVVFTDVTYTFSKKTAGVYVESNPQPTPVNGKYTLQVGDYKVAVSAKTSGTEVAAGEQEFKLDEADTSVTVYLSPTSTYEAGTLFTGQGKFVYTITYPVSDTADVVVTLQKFDLTTLAVLPTNLLAPGDIDTTTAGKIIVTNTNLDAGTYLFTVKITDDDGYKYAGFVEAVHIYNGTTVTGSKTIDNLIIYTKSSDATMRGALAGGFSPAITDTAGLYIGGVPATSIGNPGATYNTNLPGTAPAMSNGAIYTNSVTGILGNPIVVIVNDAKVKKVELAQITGTGNTLPTNLTDPENSYEELSPNETYNTAGLLGKRYTGAVKIAYTASTLVHPLYVRITAEDGTVNVYRYGWTSTGSIRGIINSVTVGGQTLSVNNTGVIGTGDTAGKVSGWWNLTGAPNLLPAEVTIAAGGTVAVGSTITNTSAAGTVTYARLPKTVTWPLLETTVSPFVDTKTATIAQNGSGNTGVATTSSIDNVQDGDYILVRYVPTTANYQGYFAHALIKVKLQKTPIVIDWADSHGSLIGDVATTIDRFDSVEIAASAAGYTVETWYLDGVEVPSTDITDGKYTFKGSTGLGKHTVTLVVLKNNEVYNTSISITVE